MAAKESMRSANVTPICFELDGICELFDAVSARRIDNGTDLLAVASKFDTRIVGHPSSCELQILYFKDRTNMPRSTFQLHGTPKIISLNCSENILAVNYRVGSESRIDLYSVNSFLSTEDLHLLDTFHLDCMAKQILWNPIDSDMFAICSDDGSLTVTLFRAKDEYATKKIMRTKVRRVCWSPRGDQIVYALQNGVLGRCDLKTGFIKTIASPQNLCDQPFEPIALEWLSTDQLAVVFMESSNNARPKMFIINTFGEQPTYIRFDDIYYSPQTSRVYLLHLPKWNMILTGSKNDAKINVLTADGTKETPRWMPHIFMDEKRARLPLDAVGCGPYSMLGIALENQSTHFEENPLISVMLTCGRLVTIKLLAEIAAMDETKTLFGTGHIARRFELPTEVKASTEQLFNAQDLSTFHELATSVESPRRDLVDAILNYASMQEQVSDAVQKLQSIVISLLAPPTVNGDSSMWLDYLRSLASATETTVGGMEHMKNAIQSLMTSMNEREADAPEKNDLLCDETHEEEISPIISNVDMETEYLETGFENLGMDSVLPRKKRPQKLEMQTPNQSGPEPHPHACDHCEKRYKHKSSLRKHEENHHKFESTMMATNTCSDEAESPVDNVPGLSPPDTVAPETNVAFEIIVTSETTPNQKVIRQKTAETHPHACAICNNRYMHKAGLKSHILKVHLDKQPKRESARTGNENTTSEGFASSSEAVANKRGKIRSPKQKSQQKSTVSLQQQHHSQTHPVNLTVEPATAALPIQYKCECKYATNHSGLFNRHRRSCKRIADLP